MRVYFGVDLEMSQRQTFKSKPPFHPHRNPTDNRHRPPGSRSTSKSTQNDDKGCNPDIDMRRSKAYHHHHHGQERHQGGGLPFTKVYTPSKNANVGTQKSPTNASSVERKSEYHGKRGGNFNYSKGNAPAASSQTRQKHGGGVGRLSENANEVGANANHDDDDDDQESIRINSTVLRRIDKDFLKLHGTASQVAVYRFNPAAKSWDTTDTVGCLFLYERKIGPRYGLVVMNRKNTNNLIQWFGSDGQVVLQAPYLLLRSGDGDDQMTGIKEEPQAIYCIWFYDNQDCLTSANILRKMKLKFEGENGASERLGLEEDGGGSMNPGQLTGTTLLHILHHNKKENISPRTGKVNPAKVITAEELESEMLGDMEPTDQYDMTEKRVRTLEQVELEMKEHSANNFLNSTMDLENELIKTLGIHVSRVGN